jgi:hypothetical protein
MEMRWTLGRAVLSGAALLVAVVCAVAGLVTALPRLLLVDREG